MLQNHLQNVQIQDSEQLVKTHLSGFVNILHGGAYMLL